MIGKTSKTGVLSGFCRIEHGGGGVLLAAAALGGSLSCLKFIVAVLIRVHF